MDQKSLEKINNEIWEELSELKVLPEDQNGRQRDSSSSNDGHVKDEETSTSGAPITTQPVGQNMSMPQTIPNCPPGLEYLCLVDKLKVNRMQNIRHMELGKIDTNRHLITNINGDKIYNASEISTSKQRNWCLSCREFETRIFDNFENEVIHLARPLSCCCSGGCSGGCGGCCYGLQTIEISSPPGIPIGMIQQKWNPIFPTFVVKNALGDVVLKIKGPFDEGDYCGDPIYHITSIDSKNKLGRVYKKNLGSCVQKYNDENVFGIEFPIDLDVRMKACILGACFLIEMMYFEYCGRARETSYLRN